MKIDVTKRQLALIDNALGRMAKDYLDKPAPIGEKVIAEIFTLLQDIENQSGIVQETEQ